MTAIVIDQMPIPTIHSLSAFRRWARSPQFPERGWISYLDGEMHVDLSMEQLVHNLLESCFCTYLTLLAKQERLGRYLGDRMLLTNVPADISTEPDGMFIRYRSIERQNVRLVRKQRSVEVVGTPDMALEIVSPSSVLEDMQTLPRLYWKAGIREYWYVDARDALPELKILRFGPTHYRKVRSHDGWVKSVVFKKAFRLETVDEQDGMPEFTLAIR